MNKPRTARFAPGAGMPPPELAGRENEKIMITEALDELKEGSNPSANITLIGPRGNGKTVLLKWVKKRVSDYNGKVECVELSPECFESHHDLAGAFANRGVFSDLAGEGFSSTIRIFELEFGISRQSAAKKLLKPILEKRCAKNGISILIDEAHMLDRDPNVARAFFNNVQAIAGDGRPLLLILAGTPDILTRLNKIEATFWNRLNKIGIGLLERPAAQDALRRPLERMGYRIQERTLDQAVDAAQCYPYFLQLVGSELHRVSKDEPNQLGSGNEIGEAMLEKALNAFRVATNSYYADRYRELRELEILHAAEAVARRFVESKERFISQAAFVSAIRQSIIAGNGGSAAENKGGIDSEILKIETKLRDVGLVWSQIGYEHLCEAGIPSLMSYILKMDCDYRREEKQNCESMRFE